MRILLSWFAGCLLLLGAAEPAPTPTMAQRASALAEKHHRFFDWALVDAFRRAGGQQPWRADAERFLTDLARYQAADLTAQHLSELIAAARAVVAAGCDDPLVRLRLGMLLSGRDEAPQLVAGSLEPLRAHPGIYPSLHVISVLRRQVNPQDRSLNPDAIRQLPEVIAAACREALAGPCDRAVAIDRLVEWIGSLFEAGGLGPEGSARTLAALAAAGGDPVLIGVLRGKVAIRAAWDARGGGWASTVTEEGWKGFHAGLAEARSALTAAWKALPASAAAASEMITVAMGDGTESPGVWFERALAADPGCSDAWHRMTSATLPRWGGSTEHLLALARRAVAAVAPGNRMDQIADGVLASFVSEGGDEATAWAEIGRIDAVCPRADEAGRQLRGMGVAWYAGRRAEALDLYARLDGLAAPLTTLDTAPFSPPAGGMRLFITLERGRLGQSGVAVRPIPTDAATHRRAENAPTTFSLLPGCWKAHGHHDPAWDARITAVLEKHAGGNPGRSATELTAAGCTDPLIRYLASSEQAERPHAWLRGEWQASWDALEAAGYPPIVAWQPAWFLLKDLCADPGSIAERQRLTPRFAALVGRLAASAGADGTTPGMILVELGDPPASDPAMLDLIDHAVAAAPGVAPQLASGLTGFTAVIRAEHLGQMDPQRPRLAWTAFSRLWPAWTAFHHPKPAAAMSTAATLAGMPDEARLWFDESVRLAYDDNMPWNGLCDGYAHIGAPDELLAFAAEIAALPASSGATLRAFNPVHSVLGNRWLHTPERLKSAWSSVDRATRGIIADPAMPDEVRSRLLYWRLTCAALAGDQPAATAAVKALKAPFDPKRLPQGIDPAKIIEAVEAAGQVAPVKPSDF